MAYTIIIPNSVRKDLDRLPNSAFRKVLLLLHQLEVNPRPSGCKKLKGRNAWRARAGDYRIIYEIEDENVKIILVKIRHRKEVYR